MTADSQMGNGHRGGSSAGKLAREVAALQAALLGRLHTELSGEDSERFASAAQQLAEQFGAVTATALGAVLGEDHAGAAGVAGIEAADELDSGSATEHASWGDLHTCLHRPGAMRHRLDQLIETHKRYGHPFGLAVFDADGPGTRSEDRNRGSETVQAILGAALHESIRLVDETFPLGEGALCVLAPNQNTVGGVRMAERLLGMLDELESVGGLRVKVTAGVVACPEHGSDAERLLHKADEAMWRARAVGQPVGVGALDG